MGRAAAGSLLTWRERFTGTGLPPGPRRNQLFVSPAKPLPAGKGWPLVVAAGLLTADATLRTLGTSEIAIGAVLPFEVGTVEALNVLNSPKRIGIALTKQLEAKLDAATLARFITITPTPAKLAPSVGRGNRDHRSVAHLGDDLSAIGASGRARPEAPRIRATACA